MPRSILFFLVATLVTSTSTATPLEIRRNEEAGTLSVFRSGKDAPLLVQNAKPDFRPYIHPIVAPDGRGVLTQYSPEYNPHQTGLYWGFTSVNGRDYFHNPGDGERQPAIARGVGELGIGAFSFTRQARCPK